jgi:hypothetical protein
MRELEDEFNFVSKKVDEWIRISMTQSVTYLSLKMTYPSVYPEISEVMSLNNPIRNALQ